MNKWMRIARNESKKSIHQHKIGTALIRGGSLISVGFNKIRNKARGAKYTNYPESLHAERDCISKVLKENINGGVLYIYREDKSGMPAIAKPCKYCMDLIQQMMIKKIIYTVNYFPFYEEVKL